MIRFCVQNMIELRNGQRCILTEKPCRHNRICDPDRDDHAKKYGDTFNTLGAETGDPLMGNYNCGRRITIMEFSAFLK